MIQSTISQLFERGGPVMWPLLFGSILGLAIILERLFFFYRHRLPVRNFEEKLLALLRRGDLTGAKQLAAQSRHPVAHIARTYFNNLACTYLTSLTSQDELRQDILKREGSRCMEKVEEHLRGLSLIAHVAPLLGLLGTVTGLVSSFHVIEKMEGLAQPAQLAAGIWESLLTTVVGLVIAIPCLAAYHGFEQKADKIARHMSFMISELNEHFGKQGGDISLNSTGNDDDLSVVKS